jgi:hypothetical protein
VFDGLTKYLELSSKGRGIDRRAMPGENNMKQFAIRLILALALMFIGASASATTVPFNTYGGYGYVYNFDPTGYYASYSPGGGVGLVELVGYGNSSYNIFEAWGGTTSGHVTTFSNIYTSIGGLAGTWSDARWNNVTDTLTALFVGTFDGKSFDGHLSATIAPQYSWTYSGEYTVNYSTGQNTVISSVPEPSSLIFMGTGLIGLAGVVRRKLAA